MATRRQILQYFATSLLASSVYGLIACQKKVAEVLPSGSKVVALGDSLTFGYGVDGSVNSEDYPSQLAQLTDWQIINEGINGDTSHDVLNRLAETIKHQPDLVLLGVGGNDVLQRVNATVTKNNILQAVQTLLDAGISVVLIAQPHFSASALLGRATDNPIYDEIAEELDIPLYQDGWSKILSDDELKSDQIHANAKGYRQFAEGLYEYLQEVGYAK